jgi:hypothetical protein
MCINLFCWQQFVKARMFSLYNAFVCVENTCLYFSFVLKILKVTAENLI